MVMLQSSLPGLAGHSGKVRDIYELPNDRLLLVATDRISAFDVVLPTGIPRKGEVLTRLSDYWFQRTAEVVPNCVVAVVEAGNARELGLDVDASFFGRAMVVRRAEPVKVECVVRGYITGSGWAEYQRSGTVTGIKLPEGLRQSEQLFEPIFTPTTKADEGHDMPMTFEEVEAFVGPEMANVLKLRSLALYRYGAEVARERGIIIADTKFEFGILDGEVTLIDEVLTPDSSRFWPADQFEAGRDQPSFDKQYVRDWLSASGWDREPPGPELPRDVVEATSERYQEAYRRITGEALPPVAG
jgi:phosphoribosylaminoimidazole-succinocarboxamide synthase